MLYVMAATWLQTSPSRAYNNNRNNNATNTYSKHTHWERLLRVGAETDAHGAYNEQSLPLSECCIILYIHTICEYVHTFCISIFFKLMLHTHTELINSMGNGQLLVELGRQHMHKYECAAINCFKPNPLGHPLLSTHNRISPQTASSICTSCESSFS